CHVPRHDLSTGDLTRSPFIGADLGPVQQGIEFVRANVDDLLILRKNILQIARHKPDARSWHRIARAVNVGWYCGQQMRITSARQIVEQQGCRQQQNGIEANWPEDKAISFGMQDWTA